MQTNIAEKAYTEMYQVEEAHWWFKSLRRVLFYFIKGFKHDSILDDGCGTGYNLQLLSGMKYNVSGIDISDYAINICKEYRGLSNTHVASSTSLPFKNGEFDLIYSMDVFSVLADEDVTKALEEVQRCLCSGGIFILQVAALPFLYSTHDLQWRVKRRYFSRDLNVLLVKNGFKVVKISYRYFFLFPFIAIIRFLEKYKMNKYDDSGDLLINSKLLNIVLDLIMQLEDNLLKYINFPVGTSLFVIAQKE